MLYFPDNTTTCFTTHLCREIKLRGEWYVGLAEIHVPCTVVHLQESDANFTFKLGQANSKPSVKNGLRYFPHGLYQSIEQLATEINKIPEVQDHQRVEPMENKKGYYCLRRTCDCKEPHYTTFNQKLCRIFGFEDLIRRQTGAFATSTRLAFLEGNRPACLVRAIPDQLYVYTDICETYPVGDTRAALLRIVSFDSAKHTFGTTLVKQFAPIHYIPVLHQNFQSIVIDIRDQHGTRIPFEYGTLTVTLHFKRNR